jgi:predicted nicotinamide N-methyase
MIDHLTSLFGQPVEDASEGKTIIFSPQTLHDADDRRPETFALFAQPANSGDLGMIDPKAASIDLTIQGRDFTLTQSPGLLQSNREGGTTGAAIWATSVRFAQWISSPDNILLKHDIIDASSSVLELGSGISGLVGCALAPRVEHVVLTDQQYTLKLLKENVNANLVPIRAGKGRIKQINTDHPSARISIESLDWETDAIAPFLANNRHLTTGADVVLACDCIYNYALIEPFTQACADICRVRQSKSELNESLPTVCVVAQHLRQPDVFEEWAEVWMRKFHTWRIPSEMLGEALGEGSGFAVHVGVLK